MTKYTQKWTLVTFLDPLSEGTRYRMQDWPLHITLADVFAVDFDNTDLTNKLVDLIANIKSFPVSTLQNAQLGSTDSPVDVTLLEKNVELIYLHNALVDLLEANGAIFNTPNYTKDGYLPHVTIRNKKFLDAGEQIMISSVALIDMFPDGDWQQRKVVATFKLL